MKQPVVNDRGLTYEIVEKNGKTGIHCNFCGTTSWSKKSIETASCEKCNKTHDEMAATSFQAKRELIGMKHKHQMMTTEAYRNRAMNASVKNPENV